VDLIDFVMLPFTLILGTWALNDRRRRKEEQRRKAREQEQEREREWEREWEDRR
jgi:hypothetical protein